MVANTLKHSPRVSIIVVNYNSRDSLETLIPKLLASRYPSFEVIVVDNDSSDGSLELLRGYRPGILLIENQRNVGWGAACNQAISVAVGKYVWLLNPDVRIAPESIRILVDFMERTPRAAIVSPLIRDMPEPELIQSAGISVDTFGRMKLRLIGRNEAPSAAQEVTAVSGAAMFMSRAMLQEVGSFDDEMFMYGEDVDLSMRCRIAGFSILVVPDAVVYHEGGATTGRYLSPVRVDSLIFRHLQRSYLKNLQIRSWPGVFTGLLANEISRALFHAKREGIAVFRPIVIDPMVWNLRHTKTMLMARKEIQRTRRVADRAGIFL